MFKVVFVASFLLFFVSLMFIVLFYQGKGLTGVRSSPDVTKWAVRLPDIAGNHTEVTGVLAGFSITLAVLIATLRLQGQPLSTELFEEAALGMFVVSFIGYAATGVMYSIVSERENDHRYFLFSVAGVLYYVSAFMSFSALLLIFNIIRPGLIMYPIGFFIGITALGAYMAVSIPLQDLLLFRGRLLLVGFFLALSIAGVLATILWYKNPSQSIVVIVSLWISTIVLSVSFGFSMMTFFVQALSRPAVLQNAAFMIAILGTSVVCYTYIISVALIVAN